MVKNRLYALLGASVFLAGGLVQTGCGAFKPNPKIDFVYDVSSTDSTNSLDGANEDSHEINQLPSFTYYVVNFPTDSKLKNMLFKVYTDQNKNYISRHIAININGNTYQDYYTLVKKESGFYLVPETDSNPIIFIPGKSGQKPNKIGVFLNGKKDIIDNPGFYIPSSLAIYPTNRDWPHVGIKDNSSGKLYLLKSKQTIGNDNGKSDSLEFIDGDDHYAVLYTTAADKNQYVILKEGKNVPETSYILEASDRKDYVQQETIFLQFKRTSNDGKIIDNDYLNIGKPYFDTFTNDYGAQITCNIYVRHTALNDDELIKHVFNEQGLNANKGIVELYVSFYNGNTGEQQERVGLIDSGETAVLPYNITVKFIGIKRDDSKDLNKSENSASGDLSYIKLKSKFRSKHTDNRTNPSRIKGLKYTNRSTKSKKFRRRAHC